MVPAHVHCSTHSSISWWVSKQPDYALPPSSLYPQGLVGQLEAQLSSLREQLSGSEAECSKLRVEVERAGHRVDEKETSSQQQQQQLTAMFDSLRADSEKVRLVCGGKHGCSWTLILAFSKKKVCYS